ncbi:MAG TPA: pilus assembly protein PilY, partial [Polaromonas sp.]
MKLSKWLHMVFLSGLVLVAASARADDTDLFNQPPGAAMPAPNILFILDNSANWSANNQAWGTNGENVKQGDAELAALTTFANSITKRANIGLMMFTGSRNKGGYVRYGIRPMAPTATATSAEAANKTAFTNILAGSSVNDDSASTNSRVIPNAYYETWQYLKGATSWADMDRKADYAGNTGYTPAGQSLTTGFAYQGSVTGASYNSPLGVDCAKTYIIYIHNNKTDLTAPSPADPSAPPPNGYTSQPDLQSAWA